MNKNITTLIACIVALIVGYSLYPIINDTQPKAHVSNNAQKHMQPESQDFSQRSETKDSNETEDSQEIVSAKRESSNTQRTNRANQEKTANVSSSKNNNEASKSEYEASADEVLSLQTWTEEHKESLKQTIDYNLPEDKAQQLMSYIEMNNPFLNEPEVKHLYDRRCQRTIAH